MSRYTHAKHPVLGKIYFTRHLITRCCQRVYCVKNRKFIDYEVRCEACKWLRLGMSRGKLIKSYYNAKNKIIVAGKNDPVIQVGDFIVNLVRNSDGSYAGKTLFPVIVK